MKTFEHPDDEANVSRAHPWTVAITDPTHKYYDFKLDPHLIRTSLEDFVPWGEAPAVEAFFRLVEWVNGPASLLESNDCGTRGPKPNVNPRFAKAYEWTCRLMLLYRDLAVNTQDEAVSWLAGATRHYLRGIDASFEWGVVGTTIRSATYVTLPGGPDEQAGAQLMLTFWAWGDTQDELSQNLARTLDNTQGALIEVCREITETIVQAQKT